MTCLPPQLALGQYESHEGDVGRHAERPKAENDGRFCRPSRVTLEHARRVRRRTASEAKVRSDHSDRRPCKMKCILETVIPTAVVI